MNIFKRKYKKSQWFLGLLDCEQHVYEGYSIQTLAKVADNKLYADQMSTEAHQGIYDYLWYYENNLKGT